MFAALFFVSVGALMDIKLLPTFIVPALILIATSFGARFGTVFMAARLQRSQYTNVDEIRLWSFCLWR